MHWFKVGWYLPSENLFSIGTYANACLLKISSQNIIIHFAPDIRVFRLLLELGAWGQGRTQGGLGLKKPLSLQFYKKFISCGKEIICFRILFAYYFST